MYAVKAIYDGENFKPKQPITVEGQYEVVITFIEPIKKTTSDDNQFYILKPNPERTPVLGRLNGTIKIPDDFDEPLDEMMEYMH